LSPIDVQNSNGNAPSGGGNYTGWKKFVIFVIAVSRKRYEIGPWLLSITNRKPQGFIRRKAQLLQCTELQLG